jgi:hypothetical protein
LSALD